MIGPCKLFSPLLVCSVLYTQFFFFNMHVYHKTVMYFCVFESQVKLYKSKLCSVLFITAISKLAVFKVVLTSIEHPIREPRSWAFIMTVRRLFGALPRSMDSVTPPVKSSIASDVLPPFRHSYDPLSLENKEN